jgi:DNA-binding transcriptional LysR family regulator
VSAGLAVSALPLASVAQQLKRNTLAALQVQGWPLQRTFVVVRHEEKYVFRALTVFLEVMRTEMQSRLEK